MKNKFEEYVLRWFHDYLVEHEEDEELFFTMFNTLVDRNEDDSVFDWLDENQTVGDYLMNNIEADVIYDKLFCNEGRCGFVDIPSHQDFVLAILKYAVEELGLDKYDFVSEFIEDMVDHILCYDRPRGFFHDLTYGGCASGMVGMLIYNSDCLKLYGKYADSMEEYKEDLEEEIGVIRQEKEHRIVHYVWMCWLCYEEIALSIARFLYEEEF